MKASNQDCARILDLDLKRAHGYQFSSEEKQVYETHVASCSDCTTELRALEALAEQNQAGALPDLDEFSRWRLVDDILAHADEMTPAPLKDESSDKPAENSSRYRWFALTGSLAAAAVAAVLFWQYPATDAGSGAAIAENSALPAPVLTGHFSLLSGEVLVGAHNAVIGDQIKDGDRVQTGAGRTVIALPSQVVLSLGPRTGVEIHSSENLAYEVVLDHGEMRVSLPPDVDRESFIVITDKGSIEVTGTVFSVKADQDTVEVRVLRGEVAISDRDGRERRLGSRAGTALGSSRVWSLSQIEEESLWKEVRVLELLDSSDNAVVDVQSTPSGADVEIDSVRIGRTPVKASIRAGYREIHLSLGGEQSARKLLDLNKGSHMSWVYDFDAAPVRGREPDASALIADESVDSEQRARSPRKKVVVLSAAELLQQAQELRSARDWTGAANTYQRLIRTYPDANESRAALISLGDIQLSKLSRPMSALKHFSNYLAVAQRGPLAREALYGKMRALRTLGRQDEEQQAISQFLERFPTAVRAREVRTRQKELVQE